MRASRATSPSSSLWIAGGSISKGLGSLAHLSKPKALSPVDAPFPLMDDPVCLPRQLLATAGDSTSILLHGISDPLNLFDSCLLLQDDSDTALRVDKLTVRQMAEAHLERATIAYLLACSTAETRTVQLVDEVIHLANPRPIPEFNIQGFMNCYRYF
jgi:hypothetical protein